MENRALEEQFRAALGTKVTLSRSRRGGKLVIHFYSDEELQGLYDVIVRPS
jgi:ParB family chromosome partitioning protein